MRIESVTARSAGNLRSSSRILRSRRPSKKFLLKSWDNLTFDGSSIRGFTAQRESDLRLGIDWGSFYWVPSDVFGPGKTLVFGNVIAKDGKPFPADIRGVLKGYANDLYDKKGYTLNAANEIEGFLFK